MSKPTSEEIQRAVDWCKDMLKTCDVKNAPDIYVRARIALTTIIAALTAQPSEGCEWCETWADWLTKHCPTTMGEPWPFSHCPNCGKSLGV